MAKDDTPLYHRSFSPPPPEENSVDVAVAAIVPPTVSATAVASATEDEEHGAPVVVDLPDGQKVILGSIEPGTVIEIAAWRGTERPDSRTTRIVLGVASNPALEEGVPVKNSPDTSRRRSRAWIWIVATIAVIGVAVLALLLSPLKFVHPASGAALGFGTANSSVVLVGPSDKVATGQLVVARKGEDVVTGQVAGVDSGQVLLQTGGTFTQVPESAVFGTVIVIVPFVGLVM